MTCGVTKKKEKCSSIPYTPEVYHSKVDIDSLCCEIQTLKRGIKDGFAFILCLSLSFEKQRYSRSGLW